MTSEQLQQARAERWRQSSNPLLTADEAREWLTGIGLCLYLPRRAQVACPAPSFAEAVMGAVTEAPARETLESAAALLRRLTADGAAVPLNLLGAAGAPGGSDVPDFLATRETLPYVFSMIGGRNWKSGPGAKASPLMNEVWERLQSNGAQTARELQTALGRELTEAAVLRALMELWHGLRVIPVYGDEDTRWELTQTRFAAEMTASQKVAQATALSALVSLYLESAIAAATEEIESFLSPLAARSRVREVVNGLSATRQLGLISVAAQPLLHIAGSLPEFEEEESAPAEAEPRAGVERRVPFEKRGGFERGARPQDRGERGGPRPERAGRERTGFGRPAAGRFAARGEGQESRPARPYRKPEDRERKPFGKKPFERTARPTGSRPFDRERASSGAGGKFPPRKFGPGGAKPWQDRGERAAGGEGERPARPRREDARGGERRSSGFGGAGKPGGNRLGPKKFGGPKFGERSGAGPRSFGSRPSGPRTAGPRSMGTERSAPSGGFKREAPGEKRPFFRERPTGPRRDGERGGERRSSGFGGAEKSGEKRFGGPKKFGGPKFGARSGAGPRSFGSRPLGTGRSASSGGFKRETSGEKRPFFRERPARDGESRGAGFKPRTGEGARPPKRAGEWKPRAEGRGFQKSGGSFGKSGKPGFKREGALGFKKAGSGSAAKPFGKSGKPFGKSGSGKPGFGKSSSGRPGFGARKPGGFKKSGGFKPPARKRKPEGRGDAE